MLGSGPAVVTQGPAGAGKRGYQRSDVPPFQDIRGRFNIRHMQRFLPDDDEHKFEDLRLQLELAYVSDRQFLEEYYKRLNETGMDQETLGYMQYQKNNMVLDPLGRGQPPDLQHRHPVAAPARLLPPGRFAWRTTGSTTTSTRASTTPTPIPTSW